MNQALLDKIESEQFRKDAADFGVGDTVRVHTKVVEGDKERIQIFTGVVIGRRGHGLNETVHRPPHQLRRRRRAGFPAAFAARGQGGSGAQGLGPPRQADLPAQAPRQGRHAGEGKGREGPPGAATPKAKA